MIGARKLANDSRTAADGAHFDVPAERLLQNWREAHDRALEYLAALGVAESERKRLADAAVERAVQAPSWDEHDGAVGATLRALREHRFRRPRGSSGARPASRATRPVAHAASATRPASTR